MLEPPVQVTFPNGSGWRPRLGAPAVSALLQRMATEDVIAIGRTVFAALGLPVRGDLAERAVSEAPDPGDRTSGLKRYRWINRALSMELLVSLLLSHLNRARAVRAFCSADGRRPYCFAGSGLPDVVAEYSEAEAAPAFRVLCEVSAKREITLDWHLGQLEQALRHAQSELGKDPESNPIIAWVVNNGDIGSDPALRQQYREFVRGNGLLEEDCRIQVVPMHTGDLAFALARLCSEPPAEGLRFPASGMAAALGAMADRLMAEAPPGDEGWMADLFVDGVGGQGSLLPSAPSSADEDRQPGSRP